MGYQRLYVVRNLLIRPMSRMKTFLSQKIILLNTTRAELIRPEVMKTMPFKVLILLLMKRRRKLFELGENLRKSKLILKRLKELQVMKFQLLRAPDENKLQVF